MSKLPNSVVDLRRYSWDLQLHLGINRLLLWRRNAQLSCYPHQLWQIGKRRLWQPSGSRFLIAGNLTSEHFLSRSTNLISPNNFCLEYDFTADWKLDIRLEGALPFDPKRALPSCIGGRRAAPPEDCAGAWDYLKRMDWHRSHLPIDELHIMAEAIRRFLDSDGDRHAIANLDELREAVDRVKAYQDFQPERFDRRELNRQLRALVQDR